MTCMEQPQVGICVFILRNNKILLSPRSMKKAVGAGTWQLPGGHLDMYETFEDGILREVREECGENLKINNIKFLAVSNSPSPEKSKHYVTIYMVAQYVSGEAESVGDHTGWEWFDLNNLPTPLFECGNILTPMNLKKIQYSNNTWLNKVFAQPSDAAAIDVLFDKIDDMFKNDLFEEVDNLLQKLPVHDLPTSILCAFVSITYPARHKLPSRADFFEKAEKSLISRGKKKELIINLK